MSLFHPFKFPVFTIVENLLHVEWPLLRGGGFSLQQIREGRRHLVSSLPWPAWAIRSKNSACVEQFKCASSEIKSLPD